MQNMTPNQPNAFMINPPPDGTGETPDRVIRNITTIVDIWTSARNVNAPVDNEIAPSLV